MQSPRPQLLVELFKMDISALKNVQTEVFECSFYFPAKARTLFANEIEGNLHLAKLLELEGTPSLIQGSGEETKIITLQRPNNDTYYPFGIENPEYGIYLQVPETPSTRSILEDYPSMSRNLILKSMRSKVLPPLVHDRYFIYDSSLNVSATLTPSHDLLKPLQANHGFSYQLRTFEEQMMLQILPHSVLSYNESISDLLKKGWKDTDIVKQFSHVKVLDHVKGRLVSIHSATVSDPIETSPFFGRSFMEYSRVMFPERKINEKNERLAYVASSTGKLEYLPTSWIYPSFTFTSISRIDDKFYGELTGLLKTHGRNRIAYALQWATRFASLEVLGKRIAINIIPKSISYDPSPKDVTKINSMNSLDIGCIFSSPSMMMQRDGVPREIFQGIAQYQGTINDMLLHKEIKPLETMGKLSLLVFIDSKLIDGWQLLKWALLNGTNEFRGFKEIFGVELKITEEIVDDFLSDTFGARVSSLKEQSYHCALIVTYRHSSTPDVTARTYNEVKTSIMERGIPVQFVTDDKTVTFGRDNTLNGKARNSRTMFGLSINILAKSGAILAAIGDSVANNLVPNSMTLGYDVARIFPKEFTGEKTVPLAAPLVIFDNKGSYVSHQNVYKLRDEVSLFEQYGDIIFNTLPKQIQTLIIHRDGPFKIEELSQLRALSKRYDIEVIPISIRTNAVPRVSNPQYMSSELGMKAGTILPLSPSDFLMMTTPWHKWDPDKLGWPNPILITFHEKYELKKKMQLLYHIFALTKMQIGSQKAVRLPVSLHYANMIARFLRRIGDPTPTYLKYFVNSSANNKLSPRWFL